MKVADQIARFLHEKGIKTAFGVIGAGNVALFEAIAALGETELVPVHHEQSAVSAAAFYGRSLGICGVAIVTTGAGSSNAITGALAALMDSVPVLIISGNEPSRYLNREGRVIGVQGFHTSRAAKQATKEAIHVTSPEGAMAWLRWAADDAMKGRPGPVWVDIPRDYFNAVV